MAALGDFLVIGYGNTLRRDDGAGPRVAEAVDALNLPGLRAIASHQLTPELAAPVSQASGVIFVDADITGKKSVKLEKTAPGKAGRILAHAVDPRALLALAREIFGHAPPAWILAIPAKDLAFGDNLSPRAQAGVRAALKHIRAHVAELQH